MAFSPASQPVSCISNRVAKSDSTLPLERKGTHSLHVKISALDASTLSALRALLRIAKERAERDSPASPPSATLS